MKKLLLISALFVGVSSQTSCMNPKTKSILMQGLRESYNGVIYAGAFTAAAVVFECSRNVIDTSDAFAALPLPAKIILPGAIVGGVVGVSKGVYKNFIQTGEYKNIIKAGIRSIK